MAEKKIKLKVHPDHAGFSRFGLSSESYKSVEVTDEVQEYIDNGILVDETYEEAEKKSTAKGRAVVAKKDDR
jgi:hypothetical protein